MSRYHFCPECGRAGGYHAACQRSFSQRQDYMFQRNGFFPVDMRPKPVEPKKEK